MDNDADAGVEGDVVLGRRCRRCHCQRNHQFLSLRVTAGLCSSRQSRRLSAAAYLPQQPQGVASKLLLGVTAFELSIIAGASRFVPLTHAMVRLDSVYGTSANDGVGKEKGNLSTPLRLYTHT